MSSLFFASPAQADEWDAQDQINVYHDMTCDVHDGVNVDFPDYSHNDLTQTCTSVSPTLTVSFAQGDFSNYAVQSSYSTEQCNNDALGVSGSRFAEVMTEYFSSIIAFGSYCNNEAYTGPDINESPMANAADVAAMNTGKYLVGRTTGNSYGQITGHVFDGNDWYTTDTGSQYHMLLHVEYSGEFLYVTDEVPVDDCTAYEANIGEEIEYYGQTGPGQPAQTISMGEILSLGNDSFDGGCVYVTSNGSEIPVDAPEWSTPEGQEGRFSFAVAVEESVWGPAEGVAKQSADLASTGQFHYVLTETQEGGNSYKVKIINETSADTAWNDTDECGLSQTAELTGDCLLAKGYVETIELDSDTGEMAMTYTFPLLTDDETTEDDSLPETGSETTLIYVAALLMILGLGLKGTEFALRS